MFHLWSMQGEIWGEFVEKQPWNHQESGKRRVDPGIMTTDNKYNGCRLSGGCFVTSDIRGLYVKFFFGRIHTRVVKTNKIFSAWKLGVYFSTNHLSSNELIGYVDLSDFYENLAEMIVRYWCTKVCRALKIFEIFFLWHLFAWRETKN